MPQSRGTWAPHGVDAWYVGPAMKHYRCYRTWVPKTQAERIASTLVWFPHYVPMPKTSSADATTAAAQELIHALRHPAPTSPLAPLSDTDTAALNQLADIFQSSTKAPTEPAPTIAPTLAPTAGHHRG